MFVGGSSPAIWCTLMCVSSTFAVLRSKRLACVFTFWSFFFFFILFFIHVLCSFTSQTSSDVGGLPNASLPHILDARSTVTVSA